MTDNEKLEKLGQLQHYIEIRTKINEQLKIYDVHCTVEVTYGQKTRVELTYNPASKENDTHDDLLEIFAHFRQRSAIEEKIAELKKELCID